MRNAHRDALESLLRETRAARVADRLPEDRRPRGGVLISISAKPEAPEDEPKDMDPDLEVYGEADDDDPELPGRIRR